MTPEASARAPEPDLQAFARALKRVWPQSAVMEEWERLRKEGFVRRALARSFTRTPRRCPCGAPHSLAEACR